MEDSHNIEKGEGAASMECCSRATAFPAGSRTSRERDCWGLRFLRPLPAGSRKFPRRV